MSIVDWICAPGSDSHPPPLMLKMPKGSPMTREMIFQQQPRSWGNFYHMTQPFNHLALFVNMSYFSLTSLGFLLLSEEVLKCPTLFFNIFIGLISYTFYQTDVHTEHTWLFFPGNAARSCPSTSGQRRTKIFVFLQTEGYSVPRRGWGWVWLLL